MRRTTRGLGTATAVLMASAMLAGCDNESAHPPIDDVDPGWSCLVEPGLVRASGTITNHSSKTSFYIIEVAFRVDGQTTSRSATIDGVEPGQTTAVATVTTASTSTRGTETRCDVTNVERFKA